MNLFVWRHAEAKDSSPDLARELTAHGRKQAQAVGAWINLYLPKDARILVSPAVRTRQTAEALGRAYAIEPRIAPGASSATVFDALDLAHAAPSSSLLVVGHQPWVGSILRKLLTGQTHDWSVRKAAVWWLILREPEDEDQKGEWALRAITDFDVLKKQA